MDIVHAETVPNPTGLGCVPCVDPIGGVGICCCTCFAVTLPEIKMVGGHDINGNTGTPVCGVDFPGGVVHLYGHATGANPHGTVCRNPEGIITGDCEWDVGGGVGGAGHWKLSCTVTRPWDLLNHTYSSAPAALRISFHLYPADPDNTVTYSALYQSADCDCTGGDFTLSGTEGTTNLYCYGYTYSPDWPGALTVTGIPCSDAPTPLQTSSSSS